MGGTGPPRGSPRADPGAARTQLVRVAQGYVSYWLRGFGASGLRGFGASGLRGFGASGEVTGRNRGRDPTRICTSSVLPRLEGPHRCPPLPRSSQSRPQCAQIADHLAQNTPNSLNFTEVVCTLGAPIPNTANVETAARPTGIAAVSVGGGRAWPDNEPTRRAKLAARTASGRADPHQSPRPHRSGGRRRVQRAGWPDNEPTRRATHSDTAPPVWRAPEGPTAPGTPAGPSCGARGRRQGLAGLRGAAPNEVRSPSLAGGRALRRPEHPWGHKQPDPASGRAAGPSGARNTSGAPSSPTQRLSEAATPRPKPRPQRPRRAARAGPGLGSG